MTLAVRYAVLRLGVLAAVAVAAAACAQPGGAAPPGQPLAVASNGAGPAWVARVWPQPQGAATVLEVQRGGQQAITNRNFLPPDLSTSDATWQLQHLGWQGTRLAVELVHRTGRDQDRWTRRFEFDLAQDKAPLVAFYTATHRQGRVDWQQVDLVAQRSTWCRDQPDVSAASLPLACPQPVPAELRADAPVTTLGDIGPAFDYVPPIKQRTRR